MGPEMGPEMSPEMGASLSGVQADRYIVCDEPASAHHSVITAQSSPLSDRNQ